jgi:hypothetical protein
MTRTSFFFLFAQVSITLGATQSNTTAVSCSASSPCQSPEVCVTPNTALQEPLSSSLPQGLNGVCIAKVCQSQNHPEGEKLCPKNQACIRNSQRIPRGAIGGRIQGYCLPEGPRCTEPRWGKGYEPTQLPASPTATKEQFCQSGWECIIAYSGGGYCAPRALKWGNLRGQ